MARVNIHDIPRLSDHQESVVQAMVHVGAEIQYIGEADYDYGLVFPKSGNIHPLRRRTVVFLFDWGIIDPTSRHSGPARRFRISPTGIKLYTTRYAS